MNSTAIYSKSGKGVQEAAGKTSLLKRADRAVLAAIDGRATLAEVAEKVGAHFDPSFVQLIAQLNRDGFIREVTAGAPSRAAKPAAKAPASAPEANIDLDFSALGASSRPITPTPPPQPVTMPPPPKRAAGPTPPPMSAVEKARAAAAAKEHQASLARAREEAERKAQEERERVKIEAEAKLRAEAELKLRGEADEKKRASAEAAARALAEAKAKAKLDAEAKAKADAEAQKARREAEQLRQRLEEERKQADRIRREAEEKARRESEELRQRLDEERKAREEAERMHRELQAQPPRPASAAAKSTGFADLIADLDSFTSRDEEERKEREEAERKAREEARRIREQAERNAKEEDDHRIQEEAERQVREEEQRRAQEEEERLTREEGERRARDEAERAAELAKAEPDIPVTEDDLDMDDVRRDERALSKEARAAAAERQRQVAERERQARIAVAPVAPSRPRRRRRLGKPIALTLATVLLLVVAAAHVVPLATTEYEKAAGEALGRPVSIAQARLWLLTGPQLRLEGVRIGEARIAAVRAHTDLSSLHDERLRFARIELDEVSLPQKALGELLGAKLNTQSFWISRISARQVKLTGPLALPAVDAELVMRIDGALDSASLRGPDNLMAKIVPQGAQLEFDITASSFAVPIAPDVLLTEFAMKGSATRLGMNIESWGGSLYDGAISGTAKIRWGGSWSVDGVLTVRNMNAGVFAPALLSSGKAEGSGRFSLAGAEPSRLGATGRVEGSFTISRGVLGAFDLSRAIQTGGRQAGGRTQFSELTGHAVFDKGAVALRNVSIGAGALNAGASADIAQSGALSGRIVADVRAANQTVRATLNLGGTIREPQVRN